MAVEEEEQGLKVESQRDIFQEILTVLLAEPKGQIISSLELHLYVRIAFLRLPYIVVHVHVYMHTCNCVHGSNCMYSV